MTARHRVRRGTRSLRGAAASGGLAFLLLVAGLLVGPLPAQAESGTLLRLAQLQPDLADVEIVVAPVGDSRKAAVSATLHYGDVLPYRAVQPGDYLVTMRPAGSTAPPAVSKVVSVQPGTAYTIAAVQHKKTPDDLAVFTDDLAPPAAGQARMRIVNGAPPSPQLDVSDAAGPVALGLPCGQASPYQEVAPGPVRLTVGPPGQPGTALPEITVSPNQVVSVVLTAGDGGPRAKVVVDAGGPAVVPPGPVHAGFGGMAGPAPGGAVSSAVLLILAAVAGAVSVRLARRTA